METAYLTKVSNERIPVVVFLVNGYQLRGEIAAFDDSTIILESAKECQLVYKTAISTIVPAKHVPGFTAESLRGSE
ncbi:MAG: RNA chaperone Hfq [Oscillospiraceae bacterium]|jgi:host factor-I protein|nr:RNA chaperone Hfq [Oscillospiraceae bacterium]